MSSKEPIFVTEMKDISELEESTVVFSVQISGEKPIKVEWFDEDGNTLKSDQHFQIEEDEASGEYSLSISEVGFEEDSGLYKCVAENKHGKTSSEATLFIEEMPDTAKKLVHKVEHKE